LKQSGIWCNYHTKSNELVSMLRLEHLTFLSALLATAMARPADNPDNLIGVEGRGVPAERDSGGSATVAIQIDPYVSIVVRPRERLFARLRWVD
jgi:hypothetical protein